MQGFILSHHTVRDEDLLVTFLSEGRCITAYRFYGLRHSVIGLGHKVDAVLEYSGKISLPRLRHVLHLGFMWESNFSKRRLWQVFIRLLKRHLHDVEEPGNFYEEMLNISADRLVRTEAKRVLLESYISLLEHEGRLFEQAICFVCHKPIKENLTLGRSFLCSCKECKPNTSFPLKQFNLLCQYHTTTHLTNDEVSTLWRIIEEGL